MPGPTLDFIIDRSGEPQPWATVYNGIEYSGEVVSADDWEPHWGELLEGDSFFRIVFLNSVPDDPTFDLYDTRTAVCLPVSALDLDAGPLGEEVRSIREAKAAYATRPSPGAEPLRGALEEAEQLARQHVLDVTTQAFAEGTGLRADGVVLQPGDVLPGPVSDVWIDALAEQLLAETYPLIPIDGAAFPTPLDAGGVALLFEALFASHPPANALECLRQFGSGLELAPPGYEDCAILDAIQEAMDAGNNEVGISTLMRDLTHQVGLSRPLATLYLLVFIARSTPAVQLSVQPSNSLKTRDGEPFLGDRITWDVLSTLKWSADIMSGLDTLSLLQPPTWRTVAPYAQQLITFDVAEDGANQTKLMESLQTLKGEVEELSAELGFLARGQGTPMPAALLSDIEMLVEVAATSDHIEFYNLCVRRAASPSRLGEAVARVRELRPFAAESSNYQHMVKYLESVPVTLAPGDLLLMREALQAQLALEQLVDSPSRWPALREQGEGFIRSYMAQYRAHHLEYHRRMGVVRENLDRVSARVGALERLNTLPAVGPAINLELPRLTVPWKVVSNHVTWQQTPSIWMPSLSAKYVALIRGTAHPKRRLKTASIAWTWPLRPRWHDFVNGWLGLCWTSLARRRWIGSFVSSAPQMSMLSRMPLTTAWLSS